MRGHGPGATGFEFNLVKHFDFDDPDMYDRVVRNSNVVINLVGPRLSCKRRDEMEYINIKIAQRIAEACKRNNSVVRFLSYSD